MIHGFLHYLLGDRRPKKVRSLFTKYAQSYVDFLDIVEQRAVHLTQGQMAEWEVAVGLQRSLKKQQVCRFEYLFRRDERVFLGYMSLDGIAERLDVGWGEAEDLELLRSSPGYADLKKVIEGYRARVKPEALAKHRTIMEGDPHYGNARNALASRARQLGSEMKALLRGGG